MSALAQRQLVYMIRRVGSQELAAFLLCTSQVCVSRRATGRAKMSGPVRELVRRVVDDVGPGEYRSDYMPAGMRSRPRESRSDSLS